MWEKFQNNSLHIRQVRDLGKTDRRFKSNESDDLAWSLASLLIFVKILANPYDL